LRAVRIRPGPRAARKARRTKPGSREHPEVRDELIPNHQAAEIEANETRKSAQATTTGADGHDHPREVDLGNEIGVANEALA